MSINGLIFSLRTGLTLAFIVGSVSAATINTDTVLGPDHPYVDESIVVVDGENRPTVVTILDGAIIGGIPGQSEQPIGIDAFGRSEIEMLGGFLMGERPALMHDRSIFRMSGGETHLIEARDESNVVLEGGRWGAVWAYDSSFLRANGPRDGVDFSVRTFDESHAVIEGDEIGLIADDTSNVVVRGGEFHQIRAIGNSRILVNGGAFSDSSPGAYENAVVDIWSIEAIAEEPIVAAQNGIVNIYGNDLRFDVRDDNGRLIHFIAGKLADGDSFAAEYQIRDQGQIILHEVPEPGTWGLLAVGVGALVASRRWLGPRAGATGDLRSAG